MRLSAFQVCFIHSSKSMWGSAKRRLDTTMSRRGEGQEGVRVKKDGVRVSQTQGIVRAKPIRSKRGSWILI